MRRVAHALSGAFRPGGLVGTPWLDLVRAMHRVRVLVGASALAVAWLLPGATTRDRIVFAALVGGVYLPYAVAIVAITRRRDGSVCRVCTVIADMLIVFTFQAVLPQTRFIGVLGYLVIVAVHSAISGLAAGAALTVAAVVLSVVAEVVRPVPPFLDGYTLGMFSAASVGLAFLLERAGAEQRRALREHARSVRVLEETRADFEEAQRLAGVGSWRWDVQADHVSWSDELFRIFGLTTADFTATYQGFLERVHPEDREMVDATVRSSFETGEPYGFEHRIVRPDGSVRWLEARGRVIRDKRGHTVSMFGAAQDITDRKELERIRREFVSGVSHDIRTPLTSIKGFTALVNASWNDLSPEDRTEFLERVERSADELDRLVVQLLEYSRLESGHAGVSPEPMPLGGWMHEVVGELAPAIEGHEVSIDVDPQLEIHADPAAMRRVFRNLVENAAKFSPVGTTIRVEAHTTLAETTITVTDEGPGIAPEDRERVFEAFYRGADARSGPRGTGLGLAVAKRYVELHGGRIWVESSMKGARIGFTLPAREGAAKGARVA